MKPRTARRTLLVALLLLTGCAAFPPDQVLTLSAGSSICTATLNGECERLKQIGTALHTGKLAQDIEAARMK